MMEKLIFSLDPSSRYLRPPDDPISQNAAASLPSCFKSEHSEQVDKSFLGIYFPQRAMRCVDQETRNN
jgi:hypothetical protein